MNYSGYFGTGPNARGPRLRQSTVVTDYLVPALGFFAPHARRMASIVLAAALLGVLGQMLSARTYTATAILQPELRGSEAVDKNTAVPPLEANMLLSSQIQVIKSEPMQRRVAEALTRHEAEQRPGLLARLADVFRKLAKIKKASPVDRKAAQIKDKLIVSYIPGSYLIQVSYTAPDRETAAQVANAVAAESIRISRTKKLSERQAIAEAALRALSMTYGDRHPQIVQARSDVESARAAIEAEKEGWTLMSERDLAATGLVVPAESILAKRSGGMRTFLMFVFLGVLAAFAAALYLERDEVLRHVMRWRARIASFRPASEK